MTRFRTNHRLWLGISLVLFAALWFIPMIEINAKMVPVWESIKLDRGLPIAEKFYLLGVYTLLFGVPAIVVGWVLQCLVTMIRAGGKKSETSG